MLQLWFEHVVYCFNYQIFSKGKEIYLWGKIYNAWFSSKKTLVENTISLRKKKGKREMQIKSLTYLKKSYFVMPNLISYI